MRTITTIYFIILFSLSISAQNVYVPSSVNGWVFDATSQATAKTTLPSGVNYYGYTAQFVQYSEFKITLGTGYTLEWGGGYWIPGGANLNASWTIPQGGSNMRIDGANISQLKSYTHLNIKQPVNTQSISVGVMTLESAPRTITNVSDNYSGAGNAVTVTITLSGQKAASEKVFIRYTKDNWSTSSVVEASSGSNPYTGIIPGADVTGTINNEYYVLTSTISLTSGQSNEYYDLSTIEYSNNSGSYFPLPVELTSFSAKQNGSNVTLNWKTATEVNNYGFEVQKSSDNSTWNKIGFVQGAGNSNSPKEYSYTDKLSNLNGKFYYRLKQMDNDGTISYSKVVEVENLKPSVFNLSQNYPNPFNPSTVIKYQIPVDSRVSIKVYNVLGNVVATLQNGFQTAGEYSVRVDGSNLASGVYFYKIEAGEFSATKKMLLTK